MKTILLIEDDLLLGDGLKSFLLQNNYSCVWLTDLINVERHWITADLVLLDRSFPQGDSLNFLPELLMIKAIPVIVLTAKVETHDCIAGLTAGARDYVTKPFSNLELLARIDAQLRVLGTSILRYGDIVINLSKREVKLREKIIDLKPKEFSLLLLFVQNVERVFHRDELLNKIWGFNSFPSTRTVDNHVLHLRKKLPSLNVSSLRGIGYRVEKPL